MSVCRIHALRGKHFGKWLHSNIYIKQRCFLNTNNIRSLQLLQITTSRKLNQYYFNMSKLFVILFIGLVVAATFTTAQDPNGSGGRVKRGHGHGHGGGYGHGPGAGGGARGPVYFCGWVGSKEGYRSYGHHGK